MFIFTIVNAEFISFPFQFSRMHFFRGAHVLPLFYIDIQLFHQPSTFLPPSGERNFFVNLHYNDSIWHTSDDRDFHSTIQTITHSTMANQTNNTLENADDDTQ